MFYQKEKKGQISLLAIFFVKVKKYSQIKQQEPGTVSVKSFSFYLSRFKLKKKKERRKVPSDSLEFIYVFI